MRSTLFKLNGCLTKQSSFPKSVLCSRFSTAAQEKTYFPRESEGNIYSVNWSLTEDGVVPTGDAYRNARLPLLVSRLSSKVESGKITLTSPKYTGKFTLVEAGDKISHDDFNELLQTQQTYLSHVKEMFVEDASLGSSSLSRVGVRVVTDSAAVALIARDLLVSDNKYTNNNDVINIIRNPFNFIFSK